MKNNFVYLTPDENQYKANILSVDEWDLEFVKLSEKVGYWTGAHPFRSEEDFNVFAKLIQSHPICKTNNHEGASDPNPFATIHVPTWISMPICKLIEQFYIKNYNPEIENPTHREWGNVFFRQDMRPVELFRIPHIDAVKGLICNMWFNELNPNLSGTFLYEYKGKIHGDYYDFMVDDSHPLFKKWNEMSKTKRHSGWRNFTKDEADFWGFDCVGIAPVYSRGVTLYTADTPHAPFIDDSIDYRWSHTFGYSHEEPMNLTIGGLFD